MRGLLFSLLLLAPAVSHSALASGSGRTGANFLRIGVGPRPAGMGEAFVGLADDVNAVGYNPAGLSLLSRQELTFMHNEYFAGVRQEWMAYAVPSEKFGTVALSANLVQVEAFSGFDQNDQPTAETSASDSAYGAAWGKRWGPIGAGAGVKFIRSRLDQNRSSAAALDAGLLYDTDLDGLRAGLSVQNLGSKARFISEDYDLPRSVRAGVSYKPFGRKPRDRGDLTLLADMAAYGDEDPYVSVGGEYLWSDLMAFRTGWRSDSESGTGLSFGVGLYFNHGGSSTRPELIFDYAFVDFGLLSHVHRAAFTLKFGKPAGKPRSASSEKDARPRRSRRAAAPEPKIGEETVPEQPARVPPAAEEGIWVR